MRGVSTVTFLLIGGTYSLVSAGDFVTVGSQKTGNFPVCCQVPNLLSCQVARIDPSLLGPGTSISLPGGITVFFSNLVGNNPNAFHYSGPEADVTITCNTAMETCHGQAMLTNGEAFVLENCGSTHVWKQLDVSSLGANEAADFKGVIDEQERSSESRNRELLLRQGASDNTTVARYSIKFYFTQELAAVTPDLDGFFEQVVTETNQGYANSEVPLIASKLCKEQINIPEVNDGSTMLRNFTYYSSKAVMLDSADVAVLIVSDFNLCGIAWFNTINIDFTFSVVAKSCATGYYTPGHEIGHNIGLMHDPATSSNSVYPHGTGHLIAPAGSSGVRTIMAYYAAGHGSKVNYYSNPNVILPLTGTPTGTETSNNAAVLLLNRFALQEVGDESSATCGTETTSTPFTTATTLTTLSATTTSSGNCPNNQQIPKLVRISMLKAVRLYSDCSTHCVNNSNCEYWAFKNSKKLRRRRCFLYQIRYVTKTGYTSGPVSCNVAAG